MEWFGESNSIIVKLSNFIFIFPLSFILKGIVIFNKRLTNLFRNISSLVNNDILPYLKISTTFLLLLLMDVLEVENR